MNESTIYRLSKKLNESNITWGVGGSTLLEYYGLYTQPDDLDVWIHPKDIKKAKRLFKDFKHIKTNIYLPDKYHFKIQFLDIEVDFVACFMVKPNQHEFSFFISPNNLKYIKNHDGTIPLTFLEDWYIIYKLLKREDKSRIIEDYFKKNYSALSVNAINISLNNQQNAIPIQTIKSIECLTQLSLFNTDLDSDENHNMTHNIYLFEIPTQEYELDYRKKERDRISVNNYEQLSIFDIINFSEEKNEH